jgi:signal peptidase II
VYFFGLVTIGSLAASLITKWLADTYLDDRIPIIGDFAGLQYVLNPGVAFGLQLPSGIQEAVIITALILVIIVAYRSKPTTLNRWGFGLIAGGALGNIIDRLQDGFVTDFFQVGSFPVFNVADSCITVGVALLLVESLFFSRNHRS